MASFLRTARGLGPDELRRLEEEVQMRKSGT
jgi:hypothetical protein